MPAEIVRKLVTEEDLMNVRSNESTCETGAYEEESDERNETNAVSTAIMIFFKDCLPLELRGGGR